MYFDTTAAVSITMAIQVTRAVIDHTTAHVLVKLAMLASAVDLAFPTVEGTERPTLGADKSRNIIQKNRCAGVSNGSRFLLPFHLRFPHAREKLRAVLSIIPEDFGLFAFFAVKWFHR